MSTKMRWRSMHLPWVLSSRSVLLNNLGVNPLFDLLTTAMIEKAGQDALNEVNQRSSSLRRHGSRRSLQIVDDTLPQATPKRNVVEWVVVFCSLAKKFCLVIFA
uniref:Uncharacterized protein n=1 Tax=Ditylenchus dipsaci TaxID=166011 RepID=A0A915DJN8_9BILA